MGNNSVPKFIFRLSRFPVYRGSVLGRFYFTLHNFDISQVTYQFYIILDIFYNFHGIPYYKNIVCTALHFVLSFVEMTGGQLTETCCHNKIRYCCILRNSKTTILSFSLKTQQDVVCKNKNNVFGLLRQPVYTRTIKRYRCSIHECGACCARSINKGTCP